MKIMTIDEINEQRKMGDILRVSELSGIPYRTIQDVLNGKRSENTKRGTEVIRWFTSYLESRERLKIY